MYANSRERPTEFHVEGEKPRLRLANDILAVPQVGGLLFDDLCLLLAGLAMSDGITDPAATHCRDDQFR